MYGMLDISASGMAAQRARMAVISANLANMDTILDSSGRPNPYRRREIFFAPGNPAAATPDGRAMGVQVSSIEANQDAVRAKYDPGNPHRFRDGPMKDYVLVPDINPIVEQVNGLEASRAYEANIAAAEATKSMLAQSLRLIA